MTGFDVLLVEDILDTGNTLKYIHDMLSKRNPESIGVVTLLDKPARRIADIKADYVGTDVPDAFVVGSVLIMTSIIVICRISVCSKRAYTKNN